MAQPNVVSSLFGITPELYQQQRRADLQAQQIKAATMSAGPGTMLNPSLAPLYAQAAQRGQFQGEALRGVAGLLGVEDPELAKIRDVQQMRSQFDVSTPRGLREFAQALSQKGYTDLAIQASAKAADIDRDIAAATKSRREATPQIAQLQAYRDSLINEVGADDPRVKEVNKVIEATGKGQGTTINIDQKGKSAFAQGLGSEDAKRVTEAEKLIQTASNELATLKKMSDTENLGVISGTGASARIEALKFLDTAGFTTPTEKNRLAASENFNKLTGDLILSRIKQLGTNPSNADRDFVARIVPQLESSPQARRQLIDYMATRANEVISEARNLSTYGRTNEGLAGYTPKIPLISSPANKKDISEYTIQELEELKKNAKPAGAK